MMYQSVTFLAVLGLGAVLLGCTSVSSSGGAMSPAPAATSASAAGATTQEWRNLIDPTMSAWRGYKEQGMPAAWKVANGELSKTASANDIVTRDEYGDFGARVRMEASSRRQRGRVLSRQ